MYFSCDSETSESSFTSIMWRWKYWSSLSRKNCYFILRFNWKNKMRISSNTVQNCKYMPVNNIHWLKNVFCTFVHVTKFLFFHSQNVNSVEVSVPVGNSDHTPYVVGLTTFVVSGGTIYLLVAIFRKDLRPHAHQD